MLKYEVMVRNSLWRAGENVKEAVHKFFTDEEGDTNMISIIIVLVIVVGLAALFRNKIGELVTTMWAKITKSANDATADWAE